MLQATPLVGTWLADAEARASVPNGQRCAIYHNYIGVPDFFSQLPLSRGELEQQTLKARSVEEVRLRPTISGMATEIEKPLDLLLPNTALATSLHGMSGVLHFPSPLRCDNPSCLS